MLCATIHLYRNIEKNRKTWGKKNSKNFYELVFLYLNSLSYCIINIIIDNLLHWRENSE